MKQFIRFFPVLFALALTSCLEEDRSDCPDDENNLILRFSYEDEDGTDAFADYIESLTVMIFDDQGGFYEAIEVSSEYLDTSRTVHHTIEPGTYYIISWANTTEWTEMTPMVKSSPMEGYSLSHVMQDQGTDALFYAPRKTDTRSTDYSAYEVYVAPVGVTEHALPFISAYHNLNIYVRGLGENLNPVKDNTFIQVRGLSSGYDFHLVPSEEPATFEKEAYFDDLDGAEAAIARFRIPHFNEEDNIEIIIYDKLGQPIAPPVSLSEALAEAGMEVNDGDLKTIDIELIFYHGYLTVRFLDWTSEDVKPIA